jgi:hypothetical protein
MTAVPEPRAAGVQLIRDGRGRVSAVDGCEFDDAGVMYVAAAPLPAVPCRRVGHSSARLRGAGAQRIRLRGRCDPAQVGPCRSPNLSPPCGRRGGCFLAARAGNPSCPRAPGAAPRREPAGRGTDAEPGGVLAARLVVTAVRRTARQCRHPAPYDVMRADGSSRQRADAEGHVRQGGVVALATHLDRGRRLRSAARHLSPAGPGDASRPCRRSLRRARHRL